ncbi:beta-ribofuranosylaminobenzene 5'-phosphate synthase family protein [Ideonella sp. A 288]|uniref:beta-ribofuranosylaminobenzene 5'-phosphate synthase family protein n=1 Tax=Ideonella sp. A 288 TaxID=1962181 RepID=UPI002873E933|nr:beta-ribofuranosylaminobenzene 5'-phosphate synthase family protein [Ideonella sp. A 288]
MMDSPASSLETLCAEPTARVSIRAPGRLHLGFLDPAGTLGRRFGSLGLVIDGFETEVELCDSQAPRISATGPAERAEVERAAAHLHELQRHSGRPDPLHLRLVRVLPAHAGFGSGTQLALAIGRAFAQWHRLDIATPRLAQWLGRGVRSGIGIAGFDQGGLLVDGGPGNDGAPASVLSRIALPAAWRVVVVQDSGHRGLSGAAERSAIASIPPLPQALAADICHQVLMRVLPGAASGEFAPFASGITRIQRVLGEHFAPAQGGGVFTSPAVGRLIEWLASAAPLHAVGTLHDDDAAVAIGQSSWGPTGFAIVASQDRADALVRAAHAAQMVAPHLTIDIVSARRTGASIIDRRQAAAAR